MKNDEKLIADQLKADPRILQAKELILQAVKDQQQKIDKVRASIPEYEQSFQEAINTFNDLRGGNLWYPYIGSGIGNGPFVELLDGSVKYDFIGGIGVHYWGHSNPSIIEASIDAAIGNTLMQGHLQQNEESLAFSKLVIDACNMDHCFLTTSGTMANENALKIAFQNKFPAYRVLAFEHCFAGRSLAITQITDKPLYRAGLPPTLHVDYIPFFDHERPEESTFDALNALKKHLQRYPKEHAVMIFELIQGENGSYPGTHNFFKILMTELKKHNIAIFVDEVQTFGRTSRLFAYQHFNVEEYVDIVSIGKLSQVCATLYKNEFKPKAGLLSQTFTGSTSMIRAGYTIIRSLLENDYYGPEGKICKIHSYFVNKLECLHKKYPELIKGPWGIGAMIAFTPFNGNKEKVIQFSQNLFKSGVISFIAGSDPMRIRFLIPMGVIKEEDIDAVSAIIEKTLLME